MTQQVAADTSLMNTSATLNVVPGSQFPWFHKHFDSHLPLLRGAYVFLVGLDRPLSDIFLDAMPDAANRQWYNCATCKHVIDTLGRAVMVDEITGKLKSVFWSPSINDVVNKDSDYWHPVLEAVNDVVVRGSIVNVLDSILPDHFAQSKDGYVFGAPQRGIRNAETQEKWSHVSAVLAKRTIRTDIPEQKRKLEEQIGYFTNEVLDRALTNMTNDSALSTRIKHAKTLREFVELNATITAIKHTKHRDNLLWRIAAVNNANFNNFKNVVVGQYVTSVAEDKESDGKAIFLSQTLPENYLRATEAPREGNVQEAQRIVANLGVERALIARRMANVDDILEWQWRKPVVAATETDSIFAGLAKPKASTAIASKPTFNKVLLADEFVRDYVVGKTDDIVGIKVFVNHTGEFSGFTVAENIEDGIIYKHDKPEQRNTVSAFVYVTPQNPTMFGVHPGNNEVVGIIRSPAVWFSAEELDANGFVMLVKSSAYQQCTLCLFAESLRHELYPVRSTMEALMGKHQARLTEEGVMGVRLHPGTQLVLETTKAIFSIRIGQVR